MRYLAFILTMPRVSSWNGKWSGENNLYCVIRRVSEEQWKRNPVWTSIVNKHFHYNFGDGWVAAVSVKEVDRKEAAILKRKSKGFAGYEWMVDSIIEKQKIE